LADVVGFSTTFKTWITGWITAELLWLRYYSSNDYWDWCLYDIKCPAPDGPAMAGAQYEHTAHEAVEQQFVWFSIMW